MKRWPPPPRCSHPEVTERRCRGWPPRLLRRGSKTKGWRAPWKPAQPRRSPTPIRLPLWRCPWSPACSAALEVPVRFRSSRGVLLDGHLAYASAGGWPPVSENAQRPVPTRPSGDSSPGLQVLHRLPDGNRTSTSPLATGSILATSGPGRRDREVGCSLPAGRIGHPEPRAILISLPRGPGPALERAPP